MVHVFCLLNLFLACGIAHANDVLVPKISLYSKNEFSNFLVSSDLLSTKDDMIEQDQIQDLRSGLKELRIDDADFVEQLAHNVEQRGLLGFMKTKGVDRNAVDKSGSGLTVTRDAEPYCQNLATTLSDSIFPQGVLTAPTRPYHHLKPDFARFARLCMLGEFASVDRAYARQQKYTAWKSLGSCQKNCVLADLFFKRFTNPNVDWFSFESKQLATLGHIREVVMLPLKKERSVEMLPDPNPGDASKAALQRQASERLLWSILATLVLEYRNRIYLNCLRENMYDKARRILQEKLPGIDPHHAFSDYEKRKLT